MAQNFFLNNQIQIHAGDPWCSALLHRSVQGISLLPRSGYTFSPGVQRQREGILPGPHNVFFSFFNGIAGYIVRVMHSSGRQEGRELPACSSSCPINTFSQLLLHLTLIHGTLPLADMKRPSRIFYRRVGLGCMLRPLMKNREKLRKGA